jgi:hypothetical protein
MTYHKLNIFILLGIVLSGMIACKKLVLVDPPTTQLVTTNVFTNNSTAIAALTSIYAQMSSLAQISTLTGLSSDELTNYGVAPYASVYNNSLIASDGNTLSAFLWSPQYNYIYQANAIIEGLQNANGLSSSVKQQLIGEAEFIRAFWHFYLVNLYGDIPIVTSTDYTVNIKSAPSSKADVYKQIVTDLSSAFDLLSANYVNATNNPTSERVRPTKWAAAALLARVYLYTQDYEKAIMQASIVINNTANFTLLSDLNEVFKKNSRESIWQIMPPGTTGYNTDEGRKFILTAPPDAANGVSLSNQLTNVFEIGDKRKVNWIGTFIDTVSNPNTTYYYPFKYKIQTGSTISEYSTILRLAEQYLIRAEAAVNIGKLSDAINDLNIIRNRAGLNNTNALTQEALTSVIQHERQVELFTEGQRWVDLKRTGNIDNVMKTICPLKGGVWSSYKQLYPIPPADISNSANLKQNTGY